MEFPLDYVRGCFPALADTGSVRLDHATSPCVLAAVEAARERASVEDSAEDLLRETRESLAFFLNSNDRWAEDELLLAPDGADAVGRLASALVPSFEPDSEIIVTELDDEWSLAPWLRLEDEGVTVKIWPTKRGGAALDMDRFESLLTDRTRLVVVAKASAVVGTIVELLPVALRVREHPASLVVNWTPFVSRGASDVRFLRADFVLTSTSPLFGSSLGVLWGKRERMASLRERHPQLGQASVDSKEVAALGAALRYIEELGLLSQDMQIQPSEDYGRRRHMRRGMQVIRHYERSLTSLALRRLGAIPGIEILGIRDEEASAHRVPNLFFRVPTQKPARVAEALAREGIRVSHGHCGSPRLVKALGLAEDEGGVCASLSHYNSESEIERFADALHEIAGRG